MHSRGARGAADGAGIGSSRFVRATNADVVLDHVWDAGPLTGTELMAATGLSRATVHGVCADLIAAGWMTEVRAERVHGELGRPAKHYAFRPDAVLVVGVDADERQAGVLVADLHGQVLARAATTIVEWDDVAQRRAAVRATVERAVTDPGLPQAPLRVCAVGLPVPIDAAGAVGFRGNSYWETMDAGLAAELAEVRGWTVLMENDANLAALAQRGSRNEQPAGCQVTLLAGERLGAGIVDGRRLLRGAHGGAGEMRYLNYVDGVGSTDGVATLAREWAREALDGSARPSVLRGSPMPPTAEEVLYAAADGDPLAAEVVQRVGLRMARVVATLGSIVDAEEIVFAGAVAPALGPVLDVVAATLPGYVDPAPRVRPCGLGADVVAIGAVHKAIEHVRENRATIGTSSGAQPV